MSSRHRGAHPRSGSPRRSPRHAARSWPAVPASDAAAAPLLRHARSSLASSAPYWCAPRERRRSPRRAALPASAGSPAPGPLRRGAPISTGRATSPVPRHQPSAAIFPPYLPPQLSSQNNNPFRRLFARGLLSPSISQMPRHYWVSAICDAVVINLLLVIVLDLHNLVAGGEGPPETLDLVFPGRIQGHLQFDIQRAGANAAAVHRAQHLNVTDRIE